MKIFETFRILKHIEDIWNCKVFENIEHIDGVQDIESIGLDIGHFQCLKLLYMSKILQIYEIFKWFKI